MKRFYLILLMLAMVTSSFATNVITVIQLRVISHISLEVLLIQG